MSKITTVQQFFRRFPNDDACLDHLMEVRFGRELDCPKCGKHGRFARLAKLPAYSCPSCGHHIHPMVGTPFMRSRTSLQLWFYAIYLFCTTRHGVPAKELQRQLGVTYKTAWRMGHEIRKYMADVDGDRRLRGHVEVDETYIGGEMKGKGRGLKIANKSIVFGMVQRGGDLILKTVDRATVREVRTHIVQNVRRGTKVSSDEASIYRTLRAIGLDAHVVNHRSGEYVRGDIHTNTLESFWSHLKRSICGTHTCVSRKHLPKYLGEFEFRYNMRDKPELMLPRLLTSF